MFLFKVKHFERIIKLEILAVSLRKAGAHFGRYFLPLSRVLSLKSPSVHVVPLPISARLFIMEKETAHPGA